MKSSFEEQKAKHGLPDFPDKFSGYIAKANDALESGDQSKFIQFTCDAVASAVEDIYELQAIQFSNNPPPEKNVAFEINHRETFIDSRLMKIYYLHGEKQLKGGISLISRDLRKALGGYGGPRIIKYAKMRALQKLNNEEKRYLKTILKSGETTQIECKKSLSLNEQISITLSAFANTTGGTIYIGIAETNSLTPDDTEAEHIIGDFHAVGLRGDIDRNRIRLMQYIKQHTNIEISRLNIELLDYRGKTLMVIKTKPLIKQRLTFYQENAYLRMDNSNRQMSAKEVLELSKSY